MAAVVPTANSRSMDVWKQVVGVRFIHSVLVSLMLAGKTCNAFHIAPFQTRSFRTSAMPSIKTSILVGSNVMILKATTVDREQDGSHPSFDGSISTIHTDRIEIPTKNIDLVEMRYLDWLEDCYAYSERHIKCPFFRRRCGDILDHVEGFVRFFFIRPYLQDSSSRLGPTTSCKSVPGEAKKDKHLPVVELLAILRKDWRSHSQNDSDFNAAAAVTTHEKGYYITGRMSTNIYRDDCEFRSPDPDLPLKGLRKYVGVASHLFDSKSSHSKLVSLREVVLSDGNNNNNTSRTKTEEDSRIVLQAEWNMSLTLNLPWKPQLSEFSGSTLYFLDEDNLIYRHQEAWGISVWDAFLGMLPISKAHDNNNNLRCPLAVYLSWYSQQQQHYSSMSVSQSHASKNSMNKKSELPSNAQKTSMRRRWKRNSA